AACSAPSLAGESRVSVAGGPVGCRVGSAPPPASGRLTQWPGCVGSPVLGTRPSCGGCPSANVRVGSAPRASLIAPNRSASSVSGPAEPSADPPPGPGGGVGPGPAPDGPPLGPAGGGSACSSVIGMWISSASQLVRSEE